MGHCCTLVMDAIVQLDSVAINVVIVRIEDLLGTSVKLAKCETKTDACLPERRLKTIRDL